MAGTHESCSNFLVPPTFELLEKVRNRVPLRQHDARLTMNISKPVSSSISGVEFSFLTEDEIKGLSVKRIVNPSTYDTLDNPVPGGLYDTALGAYMDFP